MKKLQLFDQNHGKNANFPFMLNPCLYCLERLVYRRERHQILFLEVFCIKKLVKKISNFWPKPWTKPLEKCQFCGFLKPMFSLSSKACLLNKRSKIVSPFIFPIYYMGIQGVTRGYMGLQRITTGYRGLQGVTEGYKWLQGVTKNYRNFFLTRTFPDTFSWLILHKNRSWRNL